MINFFSINERKKIEYLVTLSFDIIFIFKLFRRDYGNMIDTIRYCWKDKIQMSKVNDMIREEVRFLTRYSK